MVCRHHLGFVFGVGLCVSGAGELTTQLGFLRGGFSVGAARGVLGAKSGVGGVRNRVLAKVTSKNVRIGV